MSKSKRLSHARGNPDGAIGYESVMDLQRRIRLFPVASLIGLALMLGSYATRSDVNADAVQAMRRGTAHYDSLVRVEARADRPLPDADIVALSYLERLRLGLGSPFRLVEQATVDPRLADSARSRLAWALLGRLREGAAYAVDPVVLDSAGSDLNSTTLPSGADQVALIGRAITSASDPRAGELAVRLAYQLAASEQVIGAGAPRVATLVAAQLRDRRLAMEDLEALLTRARTRREGELGLLVQSRRERLFRVEQPGALLLGTALETEAMRAVPGILQQLRRLSQETPSNEHDVAVAVRPLLRGDAPRASQLGQSNPPQAPVTVAVRGLRAQSSGDARSIQADIEQRFAERSTNEETITAEYARIVASGAGRVQPALALLTSAVQLRAYAQEEPWFPGMIGPTPGDVASRFGLREFRFDPDVPRAWRPYYARMVESSIEDMQRVLPALTLDGVGVRFGIADLPDTALAMHDPGSRTLRFSVVSSAGTLAHEFAHDLDWQAARRLYARAGGYSTDRAMREARGPLASSVRGLATARLGAANGPVSKERPAELFARGVDWFVAVSLAREGRTNGYLTAVQDAALTGYTPASARDLASGAGIALMDALAQMTYVGDDEREKFLAEWADPLALDPFLLARRVLATRLPRRTSSASLFAPDEIPFAHDLGTVTSCAAERDRSWSPEVRARKQLFDLALDARANGIVRRWASWYAESSRPAWAQSVMHVAPVSSELGDRVVRRVRNALVAQLESGLEPGELILPALSTFRVGAGCAGD